MKAKYLLKLLVVVCTFLTSAFLVRLAYGDLIEDGKTLLIENYDVYAADAKFFEALTLNPNDQKANLWRAATVILSNPDLKAALMNLEIFGDANDGDPTEDLLLLDQEGEFKYSTSTVDTIIIDNKDTTSGYSEIGSGWQTPDPLPNTSYGDDCRVHPVGTGSNIAVWTPTITAAGYYEVYAWWPFTSSNAWNVQYAIYYDGGSKTITLTYPRTVMWFSLGKYKFSPGQPARIELSDNASSGQIVADAVKLVFEGDILDDTQTSFISGNWEDKTHDNAFNGTYKEIAFGSTGTCVWRPNIPADGKYQIFASWPSSNENATNATFIITPDGGSASTISVNQQKRNLWDVSLGIYQLKAGTANTIELSSGGANGKVAIDRLRIFSVRPDPNLTELQADLSSSLAQINQALAYLNNITNTFQDSVDIHATDSSGNPILTEIDYGDVLMFKAVFNLLKEKFNIFAAYNMNDINPQELSATYEELPISVNDMLNQYSNFGNLVPDAGTRLTEAKQALTESINNYFAAYNFITSEIDPQDNDLITFNPADQKDADFTNAKLNDMLSNLNGTSSYFIVSSEDAYKIGMSDPDSSYFKTAVNLQAFYDNPQSLKNILPQFDNNNNIIRSTMPDPTIGGLLPNMTKEEINGLAKLGSDLSQPEVHWVGDTISIILDWKKDVYPDFVSYKIYRSTTDNVNESSLKVYESSNINLTTFTDTSIDSNQRVYYYRLYTYYSNGDKIASPIRRVVTKVYVNAGASGEQDGSPERPYQLLRDGIEAAATGTKICVALGTYYESDKTLRMWNKNGLILEGCYEPSNWTRNIGANETIIDGSGLSGWSVVNFSNANSGSIDGFTVKGGSSLNDGSGIQLWRSSNIKVRNCKIMDNRRGIGIWGYSSCSIENCSLNQNSNNGIAMENSSIIAKGLNVYQNSGTGIYVGQNSTFDISGSQIYNNSGRGFESYHAYGRFFNNLVINNGMTGIFCRGLDEEGQVSIENNTIVGNGEEGGVVCFQ